MTGSSKVSTVYNTKLIVLIFVTKNRDRCVNLVGSSKNDNGFKVNLHQFSLIVPYPGPVTVNFFFRGLSDVPLIGKDPDVSRDRRMDTYPDPKSTCGHFVRTQSLRQTSVVSTFKFLSDTTVFTCLK